MICCGKARLSCERIGEMTSTIIMRSGAITREHSTSSNLAPCMMIGLLMSRNVDITKCCMNLPTSIDQYIRNIWTLHETPYSVQRDTIDFERLDKNIYNCFTSNLLSNPVQHETQDTAKLTSVQITPVFPKIPGPLIPCIGPVRSRCKQARCKFCLRMN